LVEGEHVSEGELYGVCLVTQVRPKSVEAFLAQESAELTHLGKCLANLGDVIVSIVIDFLPVKNIKLNHDFLKSSINLGKSLSLISD